MTCSGNHAALCRAKMVHTAHQTAEMLLCVIELEICNPYVLVFTLGTINIIKYADGDCLYRGNTLSLTVGCAFARTP